ncbi:MAG: gamma-glutamyltransferase, partial [Candidatus Limnocylindrales bacterium]
MPPGTLSRPLVPAFLARGSHGAVVAPHHLATAAGLGILRAGGTAVDAAIATNAVLAVVDNQACGLGGDAFWLIWDEAAGRQTGLNGSGRSASRAQAADLRARGLQTIPHRGGLSITVPGAVRSWGDAHDRFGRLPRADLLAPAIELARDGFPADDAFCRSVEVSAAVFARELGPDSAGWSAVYRPADRPWQTGQRVRLPALAKTLERIAAEGWAEPYEGETARLQATALGAAGSAIGLDDLRSHASTWTEPISTEYRGVQVTGHPPNSSGFVALE